jgi:hypothetical protein
VPPEVFLEENRGENLASENSKGVLNLTWIMDLGSRVVGAARDERDARSPERQMGASVLLQEE